MKKIFTISSVLVLAIALLAGCSRRGNTYYGDDDSYWFSRERGVVVYSDDYCPYYVVETAHGYTVIESGSGYAPYEGSIIYGDLSVHGFMNLYNYSDDIVIRGDVVEYWLNYYEAQNMIDQLCYDSYRNGGKGIEKKAIKKSGEVTIREGKQK